MRGLTTERAEELLKIHGQNVIEEQKKENFFVILYQQLNNFLTVLLFVAALLSFFIGEPIDGALILAIVILNALFGVYQEYKANEALAALKEMTVTKIRVIRDGREIEIDSHLLVPGDFIFIEEGVKVPADGIIRESVNLEVNEAALTGESMGVSKKVKDEAFMGTIVTRGRGYSEVTATGMQTHFGKIASKLANIEEAKSPLQTKLESVTKVIGIIGIVASLVVFFLATFQGSAYFAAFLLAISLAVAVVPEGLPAVMTITLSIGVKEMAKRKAIVRKLTAVEALGSITLIATDKTGTLTTNKMRVKELYFDGKIQKDTHQNKKSEAFRKLILNSVLCSTAKLTPKENGEGFHMVGDPTEGALLYLAQESESIPEAIRDTWKLVEEIPFDSVSKRMTVKVSQKDESYTLSKGAPESILELCEHILVNNTIVSLTKQMKEEISEVLETWAEQGLRVLAFSYKEGNGEKIEKQIFIGMTAIYDAPRPEIVDAIKRAHSAGIQVVMVTGDNEKTAAAIALESGLMEKDHRVLTGKQLDHMIDEDLLKILPEVRVFARVTPFHKHQIVSLYQKCGEIVAVTGDGVNDAIALKQADVGVAMGKVGTDVARETADMVITDDNFATIVDAIESGRNIIKNLRNAITYLLSCNVTEALSLIVGLLLGFPHIFYPIQFLYINLVTDGIPALALAFSPRDPHVMKRKPEKKLKLLDGIDLWYIFAVGAVASTIVLVTFFWFYDVNRMLANTAAFSVLALIQSFILADVWLSKRNLFTHFGKLLSPIFFLAFALPFVTQFSIVSIPALQKVFYVSSVSPAQFGMFAVIAFVVLLLMTVIKPVIGAGKE
ncbi:cation-translocating P-type ATPase [Candidatus Roizmanbacteria bacterium]|nr:MAG: cation-translocating P-type ATPase [Candidatus Roizmanbacteria bacterium]